MKLSRRRLLFAALAVAAAAAIGGGGYWYWLTQAADTGRIFTGLVQGVAVGGFDPVAYFREGSAVEGSPAITLDYEGATWRFASEDNREAFKADPRRYAPAYGGYCSWATSQGYLAKGDPHNWDIVDGRLYLNYDDRIQERWRKDIPGFIAKADRNWPQIVK